MRAVGMLRTGFILVFLIIAYASTLPLQFLPAIPGYIPVYIRNGDEPLENINLALAEAFAEHSSSQILKESHVALEAQQHVDNEQISGSDQGPHESTESKIEGSNSKGNAGGINGDVNVQTLPLVEDVTPVQRRETDRPINVHKKSEAVTLEVNRSKIPQLLTEREDQQIFNAEAENEKSKPDISPSKEDAVEVNSVPATPGEEGSEKLAASDVEKSEFKPNEIVDPNPNYPELPAEIPQQHNSQDFGSSNEGQQDVTASPTIGLLEEINDTSLSQDKSSSLSSESEESSENSSDSVSSNSESNESE